MAVRPSNWSRASDGWARASDGLQLAAPFARRRYCDCAGQCARPRRGFPDVAGKPTSHSPGVGAAGRRAAPARMAFAIADHSRRRRPRLLSPLHERHRPHAAFSSSAKSPRASPASRVSSPPIALVELGLCAEGTGKLQQRSGKLLAEELARQILPDGGHVSRNPQMLIDLLLDLLPLRQAYAARGIAGATATAQRHRPHDADAAPVSPRRWHARSVQRHGRHAAGATRHRARL